MNKESQTSSLEDEFEAQLNRVDIEALASEDENFDDDDLIEAMYNINVSSKPDIYLLEDALKCPSYESDTDDLSNDVISLQRNSCSGNLTEKQRVVRNLLKTLQSFENNERASKEVLYIVKRSFAKDPDLTIRAELLDQIPFLMLHCVQKPSLQIYNENILLPILLENLDHEKSIIRKSCQTALAFAVEQNLLSSDDLENALLPALLRLTDSNFHDDDIRAETATLFCKLVYGLGVKRTADLFLPRFIELCADLLFHIRKTCASNMGSLCDLLGADYTEQTLVHLFVSLCQDAIWGVRKCCADSFPIVANLCSMNTRRYKLAPVFVVLLTDTSRWVQLSAFQSLGQFISTFADPNRTGLELFNGEPHFDSAKVIISPQNFSTHSISSSLKYEASLVINEKPLSGIFPSASNHITQHGQKYDRIASYIPNVDNSKKLLDETSAENFVQVDKSDKCPLRALLDDFDQGEWDIEDILCDPLNLGHSVPQTEDEIDATNSVSSKPTKEETIDKNCSSKLLAFNKECFESEVVGSKDDYLNVNNPFSPVEPLCSVEQSKSRNDCSAVLEDENFNDPSRVFFSSFKFWSPSDAEHLCVDKNSQKSGDDAAFISFMERRNRRFVGEDVLLHVQNVSTKKSDATIEHYQCKSSDSEQFRNKGSYTTVNTINRFNKIENSSDTKDLTPGRSSDLQHHWWRQIIKFSPYASHISLENSTRRFGIDNIASSNEILSLPVVGSPNRTACSDMSLSLTPTSSKEPEAKEALKDFEYQDIIPQALLDQYVSMVQPSIAQTIDNDIIRQCAFNFPAVAFTIGRQHWAMLRPTFRTLAVDPQWKVRRTLAFSMHNLAAILGSEITTNDLLPTFISFLRDMDEVRIGVLKNLTGFLKVLDEDVRPSLLSRLADFSQTENYRNWRFRYLFAEQLINLCALFDTHDVDKYITPLAMTLAIDKVAEIRKVTLKLMGTILKHFYDNEAGHHFETCCPRFCKSDPQLTTRFTDSFIKDIIKGFGRSQRWIRRQTFVYLCEEVLATSSLPRDKFLKLLAPALVQLTDDSIPNVRIALAKLLSRSLEDPTSLCYFSYCNKAMMDIHYYKDVRDDESTLRVALDYLLKDKDRDVRRESIRFLPFEKIREKFMISTADVMAPFLAVSNAEDYDLNFPPLSSCPATGVAPVPATVTSTGETDETWLKGENANQPLDQEEY